MVSLWNIVLAIVSSVGGIASIITAVVYFSANRIADRLQAKYQLKLEKELESYKSKLEQTFEKHKSTLGTKQHISVKRFDSEFEIYQNLTKSFFDAIKNCNNMIPYGFYYVPADEQEKFELEAENYKKAHQAVIIAQDYLNSIVPFIPDDIYKGYGEILTLMGIQLSAYERRFDINDHSEEKNHFTTEDYKRTHDINIKFDEINQKVRNYLNTLEVVR